MTCALHCLQGTDDDLDAVLASFKLADAAVSAVRVEEDCPPPSARVCASFTPLPLRVCLLRLRSDYKASSCIAV